MSVKSLPYIAAVSVLATTGMGYFYGNSLSNYLLNNQECKKALDEVRNHKGAVQLLGEPIEPTKAKLKDFNKLVQIFVSGSKSGGVLYLDVSNESNQMKVHSIQLQIGKDDTKRLIIRQASE